MNLIPLFLTVHFHIYHNQMPDNKSLFNGISLDGWQVIDFEEHGSVTVADSSVILGAGSGITGIKWIRDFPVTDYGISLDAKRIEGSDFFCGMTFPVKESFCTLVIGGWGGSIVGLSCVDGEDAANNLTYDFRKFESNRWYSIRLKVTEKKIEAWIDKDKIVDLELGIYRLSLRWETESSKPFGIATWKTTGALRKINLERITN
jgi:hypothetical protein